MSTSNKEKIEPTENQNLADSAPKRDETQGMIVGSPGGAKKHVKAPVIERFEDLLRAVYRSEYRRATLKKNKLESLRKSLPLAESERAELFRLAQSDRLLDKTRQLMLLGVRIASPGLSGPIREFCREVLVRHPLFEPESLRAVLSNLPDALPDDSAINAIFSTNCASLSWRDEGKPLTKKQCEQCRTNAAHCLLLLFWAARGTSLDRLHRLLQAHLWGTSPRRPKTDTEKLYALLSSSDPLAAMVSFGLLENEVNEQKRRAEAAIRGEERVAARLAQMEARLAEVENDLSQARAENERMTAERQATAQAHETTILHWKDDYEQLRGQMLRRLKDELALLDEGLHALRRDPPKVHVMIDHAERAINGLKREMERLRRSD